MWPLLSSGFPCLPPWSPLLPGVLPEEPGEERGSAPSPQSGSRSREKPSGLPAGGGFAPDSFSVSETPKAAVLGKGSAFISQSFMSLPLSLQQGALLDHFFLSHLPPPPI